MLLLKTLKVLEMGQSKGSVSADWAKVNDGLSLRTYRNYDEYIEHQKEKLDKGIKFLEDYEKKYELDLTERLSRLNVKPKSTVLCLGARRGAEVRAFINNDALAIGIDLQTL